MMISNDSVELDIASGDGSILIKANQYSSIIFFNCMSLYTVYASKRWYCIFDAPVCFAREKSKYKKR